MQIMHTFVVGLVSVLKTVGAPLLYRYPYRSSAEGLRSDWLNIGKDIESVSHRLKDAADERRNQR